MPAAYLIVEMNISDPEQYKEYMAAAPAAVKAAGGEYLVRGGRSAVLEGDWQPHRVAVLRFPSYRAGQGLLRRRDLPPGARACAPAPPNTSTWCWSRASTAPV